MATVLLQAVGGAVGGLLGGPFGAAIGRAIGGYAGYTIDQSYLSKDQLIKGPRLEQTRIMASDASAAIPRVYGQARVGGQVIWATRFKEQSSKKKVGGGKGGGGSKSKVKTYSYYASFALGICEGEIAGIRRIWADGKIMDLTKVRFRLYKGSKDQTADPLIEAKQGAGNTPAYRGLAYIVFDDLPLAKYGNRIPQISVEVLNPVSRLANDIRSVAMIPGSTEFGYDPAVPRFYVKNGWIYRSANPRQNSLATTDWTASLDELTTTCPNLNSVSLVVTWFGTDLRAGECEIKPGREFVNDKQGQTWTVSGVTREKAHEISRVDGELSYGGTPSDGSVLRAIGDLKERGLKTTLYPFIAMDIPQANALPDPYGGDAQPAYPWRGRMTCYPAIGEPGSADQTAQAASQIESLMGEAGASDFEDEFETISFEGDEWSFRRMILHYAHLAKLAGGVDRFIIGSEMRGLSTVRNADNGFPFVEALVKLAGDVRTILGPDCDVTYASDWSEYFGYQPQDGSGDRYFHLDPLWADPAISSIGIDNYMPISDWRDGDCADREAARSIYNLEYLENGINGGEGFDCYYADNDARKNGQRTPITDGGNEPWIYRFKDLVSWWQLPHHERIAGERQTTPTGWLPQSKPIVFTELGCAAIDKGSNQPNVFIDPKSTESFAPHFSNKGRDDLIQNRFLQAHYQHWSKIGASNPVSAVYGGPMVDPAEICLWAWDARPYPWFPELSDVWGDAANWYRGHWLTGRLTGCPADELLAKILTDFEFEDFEIRADGWVDGYIVPSIQSGRAAIEPMLALFGIKAFEEAGRLKFQTVDHAARVLFKSAELVQEDEDPLFSATLDHDLDLPAQISISHQSLETGYEQVTTLSRRIEVDGVRQVTMSLPAILSPTAAEQLAESRLRDQWIGRETAMVSATPSAINLSPGDALTIDTMPRRLWEIESVEAGASRRFSLRRVEAFDPSAQQVDQQRRQDDRVVDFGAPEFHLLDLPGLPSAADNQLTMHVAAWASPWAKSYAVLTSPTVDGFSSRDLIELEATIGELVAPLPPDEAIGRWQYSTSMEVRLAGGALSSEEEIQVLNAANAVAVYTSNGIWEVIQFQKAQLGADGNWTLSKLLRGQLGTDDAARLGSAAGSPVVFLDEAVQPIALEAGELGIELNWLVGPSDDPYGSPTFTQKSARATSRATLPFSPVHLRAVSHTNGSLQMSWLRRSRIDGDSWEGSEIPLGEAMERYLVSIRSQTGTLKRSFEVGVSEFSYTAADRIADLGSQDAAFEVVVSQLGDRGQPGVAASLTVNPATVGS